MAQPRLILAASVWVALAACGERDPFIAPGGSGGGGGGTGSGGRADAGVRKDAGAPSEIRGRICQVSDLRAGAPCTAADGTGVTVEILETGEQTAVATDGTFTLSAAAIGSTLVTNTDHPLWFGGAMRIGGAGNVTLPVVTRDDVDGLVLANLVTLDPGRGILVVHVTDGGVPVRDATLSVLDGAIVPFYDAGDPEIFVAGARTGPQGTAIYFNAAGGDTFFDVTVGAITFTVDSFTGSDAVSWAFASLSAS